MSSQVSQIIIFAGPFLIAALTWFFSSRPRLFVAFFVSSEDLFREGRPLLRNRDFFRGMRLIAAIQFVFACAVGALNWWLNHRLI